MKRFMQIALCTAMVAAMASAATIKFESQIGFTPASGVAVNGPGAAGILDLGHVANGALPGTTTNMSAGPFSYQFFYLGELFIAELDGDVQSNETDNLGLDINFNISVNGENQAITIGSTNMTASWFNDTANIYYPGAFPGIVGVNQFQYANGALLEVVIYDGNSISTDNSLELQLLRKGKENFYAKLWLLEDPSEVPEPGTMALLGSGLLGLGIVARRRRAVK